MAPAQGGHAQFEKSRQFFWLSMVTRWSCSFARGGCGYVPGAQKAFCARHGDGVLWVMRSPATRNRTRDHLITAQIYSQMLCQLSYSRYESAETGTAIKGFSSSCHWLSRTLHGVVESFLGGSNLWIRSSKPESIPETMV